MRTETVFVALISVLVRSLFFNVTTCPTTVSGLIVCTLLQALEVGTRGMAPSSEILPTAAFTPADPTASMRAALKAYLHACFDARTSATVFSSLKNAKAEFIEDWYHAWAPCRCSSDSLRELVATLELVDASPHAVLLQQQGSSDACTEFVPEEEPNACTDADSSQHDHHSFDVSVNENNKLCGGTQGDGGLLKHGSGGATCMPDAAAAAEGGETRDQPSSPPAMQPFGSFSPVVEPPSIAPTGRSSVDAQETDKSVLDRVHAERALLQSLAEPATTTFPTLRASSYLNSCKTREQHACIDAAHLMPPQDALEPDLPCSNSTGTFQGSFLPSHIPGSRGGSQRSSFSSPHKNPTSHVTAASQQPQGVSVSGQEAAPGTVHACGGSMLPGASDWSRGSVGHLVFSSRQGMTFTAPASGQRCRIFCALLAPLPNSIVAATASCPVVQGTVVEVVEVPGVLVFLYSQ